MRTPSAGIQACRAGGFEPGLSAVNYSQHPEISSSVFTCPHIAFYSQLFSLLQSPGCFLSGSPPVSALWASGKTEAITSTWANIKHVRHPVPGHHPVFEHSFSSHGSLVLAPTQIPDGRIRQPLEGSSADCLSKNSPSFPEE